MYRWAKIRVPEFRGGDKWSSYLVQFRTITKMHWCYDNDVMVFKLAEALRGPALEYYNSLPAETCGQLSTLCTLFEGRFDRPEPPATTRSNLKTIIQRVDDPLPEFVVRTVRMAIQRVVIENSVSLDQELDFGVPQGSVLGPRIYLMYTKPVSDIIQRHGLSHQSYADDTQLYMTMDNSNNDWRDGLARIELCVSEIREWMNQNMLKLNDDKTVLIVFTSKYKQDLYNYLSITIGGTVVDCSASQGSGGHL